MTIDEKLLIIKSYDISIYNQVRMDILFDTDLKKILENATADDIHTYFEINENEQYFYPSQRPGYVHLKKPDLYAWLKNNYIARTWSGQLNSMIGRNKKKGEKEGGE